MLYVNVYITHIVLAMHYKYETIINYYSKSQIATYTISSREAIIMVPVF